MGKSFIVDPDNPVETIELVRALIAGYKAQEEILEDDKVDPLDMLHVIRAAPKLWTGFVGIKYVDDELAEISDEGKAKLRSAIEEFVIAGQEELEQLVEDYMALLMEMAALAKRTIDHFKPKP